MYGTGSYLGLLLILCLSYKVTGQQQSDYYVGAVVEFSPNYFRGDALATLGNNTKSYVEYIEKAKQQNADIVVFPEDGLTSTRMPTVSQMDAWSTIVPAVEDEYVPCTGNLMGVSETLKNISCAAKHNSIYVLINIAEKERCNSTDETIYHNTNVAFDRTGKIIARYRKVNLYMEPRFRPTKIPEIVTFDTDFGVRFGTFICFDILFWIPGLNMTRTAGVTDFLYPTAWFSEAPFLTAVQAQFGWSYAEDVNLLAAGYSNPASGSTGSGIYLGRDGIANATFSSHPKHRLLVSRIPKKELKKPRSEIIQERSSDLTRYTLEMTGDVVDGVYLLHDNVTLFKHIPVEPLMTQTSLCHDGFCCHFDIRANIVKSSINYHAVVYNGIRRYGREVEAGIRVCAVIQCSDEAGISCVSVSRSDTVFNELKITTTVDDYEQVLAMPSTLNASMLPFEEWKYTNRLGTTGTNLTLELSQSAKDLVTFGLYIRNFDRDSWLSKTMETAPTVTGAGSLSNPSIINVSFFSMFLIFSLFAL
ncbi:vanin-like protein 1 [Colletes gigas]|uniref:vanin-like protein 1 n=1 Tax=Colletes gigas TaxID=935657 RepID=UPI001C9AB250|nr:vanin-like protein 1 [Colletes gigas]XP_043265502.1 vanin-like protein 1 [Colletes gigas]